MDFHFFMLCVISKCYPSYMVLLWCKICIKSLWFSDLIYFESLSSHTLDCYPVSFLAWVDQSYRNSTDLGAGVEVEVVGTEELVQQRSSGLRDTHQKHCSIFLWVINNFYLAEYVPYFLNSYQVGDVWRYAHFLSPMQHEFFNSKTLKGAESLGHKSILGVWNTEKKKREQNKTHQDRSEIVLYFKCLSWTNAWTQSIKQKVKFHLEIDQRPEFENFGIHQYEYEYEYEGRRQN